MRKAALLVVAVLAVLPAFSRAACIRKPNLRHVNSWIAGQVIDYTANHGEDRRLFSEALGCPRDLYVYLPPHFNPDCRYPLLIYLHGYMEDETSFVENVVWPIDQAIQAGKLPPLIIAAPDGTLRGEPKLHEVGSYYLNSLAGRYQDWVVVEVWDFMLKHYPIRPEREAHIVAGVSMGGFAAYNIAIKHRDRFGIVVGVLPALNLRWVDCHHYYLADFDPHCWGWRQYGDPKEVVGLFVHGLIKVRLGEITIPIFGTGEEGVRRASLENPIELVDRTGLKPHDLDMFIGYARHDEFNLDAQTESFLHYVRARGIQPTVCYDPNGRHSSQTAAGMIPPVVNWLNERLRCRGLAEPLCTEPKK